MQEKLFEYAVIRVVPQVEREEFLNVGVILYCNAENFLNCMFNLDEERLLAFSNKLNLVELKARLDAFHKVCAGSIESETIGKLPIASRFRWLTSKRSTVIQTSDVHPGLTVNADDTLSKLFQQLVRCNIE